MYSAYWENDLRSIIPFVKANKELILDGDFDRLYEQTTSSDGRGGISPFELTGFLLDCGINPLNYLTAVPRYYAVYNGNEDTVVIPKHITDIGASAFSMCDLGELIIESEQPITIGQSAFKEFTVSCLTIKGSIAKIDKAAFCEFKGVIKCSEETENKIRKAFPHVLGLSFERL